MKYAFLNTIFYCILLYLNLEISRIEMEIYKIEKQKRYLESNGNDFLSELFSSDTDGLTIWVDETITKQTNRGTDGSKDGPTDQRTG